MEAQYSKFSGEVLLEYMKVNKLTVNVSVATWLYGNQAVLIGFDLQVSKQVYPCLKDPDTMLEGFKGLSILQMPKVSIRPIWDVEPLEIIYPDFRTGYTP